jgi:hypothetical protein
MALSLLRRSGVLRPWTAPLATGDLPHVPISQLARYTADSWLLRFREGITIEAIFAPGRRLGANLDATIADMHRLIRNNSDLHPGGATHRQLVSLGHCLCVLRQHGRVVGFATSCQLGSLHGRPVMFMGATCIDRSFKSRNWAYWLSLIPIAGLVLKHGWRGIYLTSRTSSPRVLGIAIQGYDMYPRPLQPTPPHLLEVGAAAVAALSPGATYDHEGMILRGIRQPDPGFAPPDRHHPLINQYCDDLLDYQAGDAFVLACHFTVAKMVRSVWAFWGKARRR